MLLVLCCLSDILDGEGEERGEGRVMLVNKGGRRGDTVKIISSIFNHKHKR